MFSLKRKKPGYALATVLVLLGVAMFGVGALVGITGLEAKISRSQQEGMNAYYVAESGMSDALWQLQNNASYKAALAGGTLNASYSVTNFPQSGQSYTVTLATNAKGAGYGTVTVDATWDNGTYIAKRRVQGDVFSGSAGSPGGTGSNAVLAGSNISAVQGGAIMIQDGDFSAKGNVSFTNVFFSSSPSWVRAAGSYTNSNSTVQAGGISATNVPPVSTVMAVPGVDFPTYQSTATTTYTPSQFTNLLKNNVTTTLNSPIVYVTGSVTLGAQQANHTLNLTGLLVINGSFNIGSAATNFYMNIYDPGNGKSGLLTAQNLTFSAGNITINGVMYCGLNLSTSFAWVYVYGAVVAGQSITTSAGGFTSSLVTSRTNAIFGVGATAQPFQVQHWEEEY